MQQTAIQEEVHVPVAQENEGIVAALQSPTLAVIAAFVVRVSLLWLIHRDRDAHVFLFFPTSHEAWDVAWAMVHGKGFSSPLTGMQGPTAWVAPAYPWLIAQALRITGQDGYAATILCLFLNCVASALTCWPIYGIGKKVMSSEVGIASAWLWVFLPTAVLFPLEWLWDPSFSAFFVALLIYWTLDFPAGVSMPIWAGYGAAWAISMLMNPALGILFPFLLFWLIQNRRKSHESWWRHSSAAILGLLLCLAPWTARNYAAFGRLIPVKDNFGLEFWLGNNSSVKRNWSPDHHPVAYSVEMQRLLQMGEIGYMEAKQREAVEFIDANPRRFRTLVLQRIADTWTGYADVPSDRWVHALRAGSAYVSITTALSLLAFAGFFLAWRAHGWSAAPILVAPVIFPLLYYLTHSTLRYRHPIDPIIAILAMYALLRGYSWVSLRFLTQEASQAFQPN